MYVYVYKHIYITYVWKYRGNDSHLISLHSLPACILLVLCAVEVAGFHVFRCWLLISSLF